MAGILAAALIGVLIGVVILALLTIFFQWLWNSTMPEVFPGVRTLGFGQAFKILLLASILFGGHRVIERSADSNADQETAEEVVGQV